MRSRFPLSFQQSCLSCFQQISGEMFSVFRVCFSAASAADCHLGCNQNLFGLRVGNVWQTVKTSKDLLIKLILCTQRRQRSLNVLNEAIARGEYFGQHSNEFVDDLGLRSANICLDIKYFSLKAAWQTPPRHCLDALGFNIDRPIDRKEQPPLET